MALLQGIKKLFIPIWGELYNMGRVLERNTGIDRKSNSEMADSNKYKAKYTMREKTTAPE
jgi:hypothetical protein